MKMKMIQMLLLLKVQLIVQIIIIILMLILMKLIIKILKLMKIMNIMKILPIKNEHIESIENIDVIAHGLDLNENANDVVPKNDLSAINSNNNDNINIIDVAPMRNGVDSDKNNINNNQNRNNDRNNCDKSKNSRVIINHSDNTQLNTIKVAETPINSGGASSVAIGFRSFHGDVDSLEAQVSNPSYLHADDETNLILISMSGDGNTQSNGDYNNDQNSYNNNNNNHNSNNNDDKNSDEETVFQHQDQILICHLPPLILMLKIYSSGGYLENMIISMVIDDNLQSKVVEDNDKSAKNKFEIKNNDNAIIISGLNIPNSVDIINRIVMNEINNNNDIENIDIVTDQLGINENINDIAIGNNSCAINNINIINVALMQNNVGNGNDNSQNRNSNENKCPSQDTILQLTPTVIIDSDDDIGDGISDINNIGNNININNRQEYGTFPEPLVGNMPTNMVNRVNGMFAWCMMVYDKLFCYCLIIGCIFVFAYT